MFQIKQTPLYIVLQTDQSVNIIMIQCILIKYLRSSIVKEQTNFLLGLVIYKIYKVRIPKIFT